MNVWTIITENGSREWQADEEEHAVEQHNDSFPDEAILAVTRGSRRAAIQEAVHGLADVVVSYDGYADDSEGSDRRSVKRDELEGRLTAVVNDWAAGQTGPDVARELAYLRRRVRRTGVDKKTVDAATREELMALLVRAGALA